MGEDSGSDAPWGIVSIKPQGVDYELPMQPITGEARARAMGMARAQGAGRRAQGAGRRAQGAGRRAQGPLSSLFQGRHGRPAAARRVVAFSLRT